nr:TnpV protein [Emergencia sp. 1XD21-10]
MGGTYEQQGDYLIPCLTLPSEEENRPVSLWEQRNCHYLKQNHRVIYMNLLTNDKLNSYLADINEQAEDMFLRLINQMVECQGVIERLNSDNQMKWVARMNNIQSRATEIVNHDIIYN